jgi:hypothetical protein
MKEIKLKINEGDLIMAAKGFSVKYKKRANCLVHFWKR